MAHSRSRLSVLVAGLATLLVAGSCAEWSAGSAARSCEYWVSVMPGQDWFVLTHVDRDRRSHEVELPAVATGQQGADPDVSPNGRQLAFVVGESAGDSFYPKDVVVTALDGEVEFQASLTHVRGPRFSPDGTRLAFTWHENNASSETVRVVDLRTKEATEFETSPLSRVDWMTDDQLLIATGGFDGPSTLRVVSTTGDTVRELGPPLQHVADLSVAPDSDYFAVLHAHNTDDQWTKDLLVFNRDGDLVWSRPGRTQDEAGRQILTGVVWLTSSTFRFVDQEWVEFSPADGRVEVWPDATRMNQVSLPNPRVEVLEQMSLFDPIGLPTFAVRC